MSHVKAEKRIENQLRARIAHLEAEPASVRALKGALAELAADGEVPPVPQRQVLGRLPERELGRDADFGRVRQQEVAALGRDGTQARRPQ